MLHACSCGGAIDSRVQLQAGFGPLLFAQRLLRHAPPPPPPSRSSVGPTSFSAPGLRVALRASALTRARQPHVPGLGGMRQVGPLGAQQLCAADNVGGGAGGDRSSIALPGMLTDLVCTPWLPPACTILPLTHTLTRHHGQAPLPASVAPAMWERCFWCSSVSWPLASYCSVYRRARQLVSPQGKAPV